MTTRKTRIACAVSAGLAVLILCGSVGADISSWLKGQDPRWKLQAPRPAQVGLVIEATSYGKETRLQIPRKLLTRLLAAAPGEAGDPNTYAVALGRWLPPAAGVAALLLVPCGAWLAKRRPAVVAGIALICAAASVLTLDGPGWAQSSTTPSFKIAAQVQVDLVDIGDAIKLILNRNRPYETKYMP